MSDDAMPTKPRIAVALQYEEGALEAPRVVAKGRGFVAEKIIELAEEHGVLVETNPILAEALSGVDLDEEIPVELYEAMAVVIGYVLRQSKGF
ncbi:MULTISPECIES: EscU/YscU/HrcU family type III secretion system export apparatus switch protein [unclassified Devosia]|uniref:EscU/YscU/HrcU family type III secretion system export apparatus switch protein n=1 Tax=unclassified Devosia TaxID=196773 RepID=UPI00145E4B5B|nr:MULTISPECIES: EscU/YscU/HrcU family type III secretion system export apparatus switch protein [unclassified Devosia]MBJ6985884.1 EscU/YscU/HrcU family type III secretion system export apparatus switch protein [Devosia sp. MC521]QMW61261.1 EscU/YscU/HrcU family type III secretion system export apparatus switch protein [Devosia sp. MC521]